MITLGIIIPVFNEEKKIRGVIQAIPQVIEGIEKKYIVVVDDGSSDNTVKAIEDLGVIVVRHEKNLGLGKTFYDGIQKALDLCCDFIVNIDGDGQFDPKDIPRLLEPLLEGRADFVTASRFKDKTLIPKMPWIKLFGNKCVSKIISFALSKDFQDVSCGFRAYTQDAVLHMNLFGKFTYTQETFLDLGSKGLRIQEVPVVVQYFLSRKSRIASSVVRYAWRTLKIILRTVRDYKPMKFFGILGILFFCFGVILEIGLISFYFIMHSFSPFKFIGFIGAFFNIFGMLIFFLGLLADMLYRIRMNQEEILYRMKKEEIDRNLQVKTQ